MDYAALPPEINSGRLYSGQGSAPMMATAQAWDTLSQGLYGTALQHTAAVGILGTVWMGPSAASMQQAARYYSSWVTATARLAETTAAQARAAAAAYETARAASVHPAAVATNRTLLARLVATNLLGQNTPAVMATEAQYAEMWAQDVAAMFGYHADSAAASQLTAFSPPHQLTNFVANLLGGQTPAQFLYDTFQSFLSSGTVAEIPLGLLSLLSAMWAVGGATSALSNATSNPVINVPSAPSLLAEQPNVRVAVGVAQRVGLLRVPPDWARPIVSLPPGSMSPRTGSVAPLNEPMPLPLPVGVPRGGTPPKQEKPPPEYGAVVRFVPRPPAGG